jgi:hypothetical protein
MLWKRTTRLYFPTGHGTWYHGSLVIVFFKQKLKANGSLDGYKARWVL